jgi:hypothetical protein
MNTCVELDNDSPGIDRPDPDMSTRTGRGDIDDSGSSRKEEKRGVAM